MEKMKKTFLARNVFHGTHGYFLVDGMPIMEMGKFSSKLKINRETIQFANEMAEDTKMTGFGGEWSATIRKVYSRMKDVANKIKEGKDVRVTIVGVLSDPDALGEERITMYNCWFNDLNLMDFEIGKLVEEEIGGGFTDFEYIDSVEPPAK